MIITKKDNTNHARVQRTTAGMDNVIALITKKSSLFDKAGLVAAQMLFKEAILDLLQQGIAVNLFELGTLYPCAQGSIIPTIQAPQRFLPFHWDSLRHKSPWRQSVRQMFPCHRWPRQILSST